MLSVLGVLLIALPVLAAKNESGSQQGSNDTQQEESGSQQGSVMPEEQTGQPRVQVTVYPTGAMVENKNEVKTQNQGEDSQLKTATQENENESRSNVASKSMSPRSDIAKEHMNVVAQMVESLLMTKSMRGGIGDQVREIAQEQKSAQEEIMSGLSKVDSRHALLKSLIGPDYAALKSMQKTMEQNQMRIEKLQELQNQLTNKGEITMVEETIRALTEQNMALQDRVQLEEKTGSMFGWLFQYLAK